MNVSTKVCIYPILACFSFIRSVNRVENISFLECTTEMQKRLQHIQRPWEESSILPTGHTASNFQRNALNIVHHQSNYHFNRFLAWNIFISAKGDLRNGYRKITIHPKASEWKKTGLRMATKKIKPPESLKLQESSKPHRIPKLLKLKETMVATVFDFKDGGGARRGKGVRVQLLNYCSRWSMI